MPASRLESVASVVPSATDVQVAPLWSPSYHQAPLWLAMVSLAPEALTSLAVSVTAAGARASEASDATPSPVAFTARTLNW